MDEDLRQALHVPELDMADAANRLSVLHWLQNLVGSGAAAWDLSDPLSRQQGFQFVRIRRMESFWDEEGPASLTNRMTALLGALGRTNRTILVVVRRDGPQLSWMIGFDDRSGSLGPAVGATFPGAVLEDLGSETAGDAHPVPANLGGAGRLALVGVPPRLHAPKETPLVERLAVADVERWAFVSLARPVAGTALVERYQRVSTLRRSIAAYVRATRALTEIETREDVDPVAELASDLLKREERRSLQATRITGFAAQTWLIAEEPSLASLGAIAAAALVGDGVTARPLRVLPEGPVGSATSFLIPDELAAIVQPPVHDLRGFEVRKWSRFDFQPEDTGIAGPSIVLGRTPGSDDVSYPADALTTHALVSGTTGSGKSSLLRSILEQVPRVRADVPYLIVEPTKDEYATLPIPGLRVWRIGGAADDSWHLNPLEVPQGIPLQTHIDLLIALFESTFALFPPLPYIVEMGLRRVYVDRGWDLVAGRNALAEADPEHPAFPTLRDLQATSLELVEELGYVGEVQHNVRGALHARLGSLLEGPKGMLVDTDEPLDVDRLLGEPCVVNLDLVGSDREKAFFMGLLLIRLWEARRGHRSRHLTHLTVLEEAHRILPAEQPTSADPITASGDFAAETFTNLLAEVRAAGEGLIIVEQSPRRLASGAVTNTGLKVAFRTMGAEDRHTLGAALNLEEEQERALTSLDRHHALVFWAGMDTPVRMTALAEFPPEGAPPAPAEVRRAQPVVRDPDVGRLADLLLRVNASEAAAVRLALEQRVQAVLPAPLVDRSDDVITAAIQSAAERLGRTRALPHRMRREMIAGALAQPPQGTVLQSVDGACSCDGAGTAPACPVREIIQDALRTWHRQGRGPTADLNNDYFPPDRAADYLRARVTEAYGTDVASTAVVQGVGCLTIHALRGTGPLAQVREKRDRYLAEARRGSDAH